VEADSPVDAFQKVLLFHRAAAERLGFLRGMEENPNLAREIFAKTMEGERGAKSYGTVHIMPAGVHDAGDFGTIGQVVAHLLDRQSIDIAANGDGPLRSRSIAHDVDIDACLVKGFGAFEAEAMEHIENPLLRSPLGVRQFRLAAHHVAKFDHGVPLGLRQKAVAADAHLSVDSSNISRRRVFRHETNLVIRMEISQITQIAHISSYFPVTYAGESLAD
jgi:hypothetical protein